jgi:hypothetical protein
VSSFELHALLGAKPLPLPRPSRLFVSNGEGLGQAHCIMAENIIINGEGNARLRLLHRNFALCDNFETCYQPIICRDPLSEISKNFL